MAEKLIFPKNFLWGAGTSAYQVEGAWNLDRKGKSIWDEFSHTPGKIADGRTGDIACDGYNRVPEDVGLMKHLNLETYRFSLSWPRIFPEGKGQINSAGLDFYDRLVDNLFENNIEPFPTLYHWDLPQALQDNGGWGNRETAHYFAEYASVVGHKLGDRVKSWTTHNEPWVTAFLGHMAGVFAPGLSDPKLALQVAHNLLLSHGEATQALRTLLPEAQIGIVLNFDAVDPATNSKADQQAAKRYDGFLNRWFLNPLFRGNYPDDMLEYYAGLSPQVEFGDMDLISTPIDFLGVNYYRRNVVKDDPTSPIPNASSVEVSGSEYTDMDWEVYPQGLYETIMRASDEYKVPAIYITENGAAYKDSLTPEGRVEDRQRENYLRQHLIEVHRAIQSGANVKGYIAWSLMDNFEWALGFSKRFGIVHVDFDTQKRTIKNSGHWYSQVIAQNGLTV